MMFRTAYNRDKDGESLLYAYACTGKSRTIQSAKDECDINVIVKRYGITGLAPQNVRAPTYEDFIEAPESYQGALNAIRSANESFMKMPADVRFRFGNDPAKFVDFCSDPSNVDEMVKMGLAVKREPSVAPVVVPEVKPSGTSG